MRTVTRVIAGVLGGIVILLGIAALLFGTVLSGTPVADSLGNAAVNAAIDASGVKGRIEDALRDNADAIAGATGLSPDQVDGAIDQLDIQSWSATSLPADAVATGSFEASYGGTQATVTTYADPSYVTVRAQGQSITLSVPSSAQSYISYLAYL